MSAFAPTVMKNEIMNILAAASAGWKAQFDSPPDIPLVWSIDDSGMLLLDGVWVCPAKQLRIDDEIEINRASIELSVFDGYLAVVITRNFGFYEIVGVERSLCRRRRD